MKYFRDKTGSVPVKLMIIILLVIGLGFGALTLTKAMKKVKHTQNLIYLSEMKLEEFGVNLADTNESRYLRVCITLEIESKKDPNAEGDDHSAAEKPADDPKVRDAIINVLTKRKYAELLKEDGKLKLKEDLKAEIDKVLQEKEKDTKVAGIYFTSFIMQ